MKNESLVSRLRTTIRVLLQFGEQHAATLTAMEAGTYLKDWRVPETDEDHMIRLNVGRLGSIYLVKMAYYINGRPEKEEHFLATYGWHCNGHLIGIEKDYYLVFNPLHHEMYLMEYQQDGTWKVDTYEHV